MNEKNQLKKFKMYSSNLDSDCVSYKVNPEVDNMTKRILELSEKDEYNQFADSRYWEGNYQEHQTDNFEWLGANWQDIKSLMEKHVIRGLYNGSQ